MITNDIQTLKIHKLTQVQYNRELESGNIDESALYLTPDEETVKVPKFTSEDNGKFLCIIDGTLKWVNIPNM